MNIKSNFFKWNISSVGFCSFLLTVLIIAGIHQPVKAAEIDNNSIQSESIEQLTSCDKPGDWSQTTRVKNPQNPTKEWKFTIDDPLADVTLKFFYYQDYDKSGCPFDCTTGECQSDEGGKGKSPLGMFYVVDGKEGANRGTKKLEGRLTNGTYKVVFTASGHPGSINVGLNVRSDPVPTPTMVPTDTPTPTEIPPTTTETPPADTATPTPSGTVSTPTEPVVTPTPTNTPVPETKTPPPKESPTATPTRKPPSTLPPPTAIPGSPSPHILIPVTGVSNQESGLIGWILIPLGIGLLGVGITFYGIIIRHNQE
jgi:hypothetical protein